MSNKNIIPVDFCNKRLLSFEDDPTISDQHYSRLRFNKSVSRERRFKGLPGAIEFREAIPYAIGLYYLMRDQGNPADIKNCQDKVSELLLTLDEGQMRFFGRLVEREIDIEGLSWIESVDISQAEK